MGTEFNYFCIWNCIYTKYSMENIHIYEGTVHLYICILRNQKIIKLLNKAQYARKRAMKNEVPIWEKYTLTIEEASQYFRIGENKLRRMISENPQAKFLLMNGNRIQIKRVLFEKLIDELDTI